MSWLAVDRVGFSSQSTSDLTFIFVGHLVNVIIFGNNNFEAIFSTWCG